jgi:hypothetical protein
MAASEMRGFVESYEWIGTGPTVGGSFIAMKFLIKIVL